jgi:SAM-dependent methyltransferase
MARKTPHYGYYAFTILVGLAGLILVVGAVLFVLVSRTAGVLVLGFGVYIMVSYPVSIYWLKQSEHLDVSNIVQLKGDERALDVGCGLGKVTIGVAKHLTTGKVMGIDIWNTVEIPGNSPERAYENAEIEGVQDKVEFRSGDVLQLDFDDNTFDLVTGSSVLNNLAGDEKKLKAMKEIYRVLKPGGTFFLLEPLRDLRGLFTFTPFAFWELLSREKWIELLEEANFVDLDYDYNGQVISLLKNRSNRQSHDFCQCSHVGKGFIYGG